MPKSLPATRGCGSGDICADARHFTSFALIEIDRLMRESEDEKLRFTCARYLIEQGWGRPALRRTDNNTAEEELDPVLIERIHLLIDTIKVQKITAAKSAGHF